MSQTLDRLDEVMARATNDELIELSIRASEELNERVASVSRLALDTNDRDLVNEARVFSGVVLKMLPRYPFGGDDRLDAAAGHMEDCRKELDASIAAREASPQDAPALQGRSWRIRQTPAAARIAQAQKVRESTEATRLVASVDFSREAVLAAFRQVAETSGGRPLQVGEVAIALCPEAEPANTPGRQSVINRVSQVVCKLAATGAVVKTTEASYEKRQTCRWALAASSSGSPQPDARLTQRSPSLAAAEA